MECWVRLAALGVLAGFTPPGHACLWDYDTLAMERARMPNALEAITGKFLRHSKAYYQWRVDDRVARIKSDPTAALYDDLGVAYDKLGEHAKAIETAQTCERLYPGRYETAANLGTFLIHAGSLEEGLEHIDRALELNPDAHFGRERYQKLLVEYVLSKRVGGEVVLPLEAAYPEEQFNEHHPRGFAAHCRDRIGKRASDKRAADEYHDALQGVLGMMKFGDFRSPILLEALGDLLLAGHRDADSKRLAARAYLRAGAECRDSLAAEKYQSLAEQAVAIHVVHDSPGMVPCSASSRSGATLGESGETPIVGSRGSSKTKSGGSPRVKTSTRSSPTSTTRPRPSPPQDPGLWVSDLASSTSVSQQPPSRASWSAPTPGMRG